MFGQSRWRVVSQLLISIVQVLMHSLNPSFFSGTNRTFSLFSGLRSSVMPCNNLGGLRLKVFWNFLLQSLNQKLIFYFFLNISMDLSIKTITYPALNSIRSGTMLHPMWQEEIQKATGSSCRWKSILIFFFFLFLKLIKIVLNLKLSENTILPLF